MSDDYLNRLFLSSNQKIENLFPNLQKLTLGSFFDHKLDICIALPKLQNLTISSSYKHQVPPFF